MSEVLKIVLSLSLSGALLFFIILIFKQFYKNKLCKRWQYYIWLIVVVRMLLPFTPETTLIGWAFEYLGNIKVETIQTAPPVTDTQSDFHLDDNNGVSNGETQEQNPHVSIPPSISIPAVFAKVYENLWILWAAIALALLVRKITMYQSFVRFVKAGQTEVADIEILNMLAGAGEKIGVKRPVELFVNPLISSPMLIGFFRPYIILPNIELERTELAYIMGHELTHYKHLDMFYKWLVQITVCVHWFNPFAYLLAKEINKCCELSCDESMIRTMDMDEKKAYGDTLLNSLKVMGNYNDKLATVTLTESAEQLKERLDAIMKFKKASKTTVTMMLVLTLVFAVGAAAIGAYAATPANQMPDSPWSFAENSSGKSYTYSQESYYQAPYIFEIGRNINENDYNAYPDKTVITLSDKTTVTVSFDAFCKEYSSDEEAMTALKTLLEKLKKDYADTALPVENPLIVSVDYVGDSELNQLAADYYSGNAMTKFVAVFPALEETTQKLYCDKMYADGKIAFFTATLNKMDTNTINHYAEQAYADNKVNFFSTMIPFLNNETKNKWIVKSSEDGKNGFLEMLTQHVTYAPSTQSSGMIAANTKEVAISLDINNGGVEVLPSATGEIKASYDSVYYDVDITNKDGKWNVSVSGKVSMMGKTDPVQLHIPDRKCMMDVNVLNGNFMYTLPENCKDVISITAENAGIDFSSNNQYQNSAISLTAKNKDFLKYEKLVYPNYFSKTNTGFEYTNGTGANKIDITLTGYTSVNFVETSTTDLSY